MSRIILKSTACGFVGARVWHIPILALGILLAGCGQSGQSGGQAPAASAFQAANKTSVAPDASLAPPANLAVTGTGSNQVSLSWTASSGASDYYVFYGTTSGDETTKSAAIVGTSTTITGLNDGTTYYFVVKAYSHTSGITSAASNEVSATIPLPAPTGLQVTIINTRQVTLTWSAASSASDYYVYYGTATGEETTKSAPVVSTSTTITGLNGATTYYFVVKSYNHASGTTSPASNEVSAITPLPAPANLTATPGNAQVTLSWTGSPGASDYYVYSTPAGGATTKSAAIVSTSATITGLTNGTVYSFYVEAYNHPNAVSSPASNQVSATPSSSAGSSSSSGGASSGSSSSSSGGASSGSSSSGGTGSTVPNYLLAFSANPVTTRGATGLFVVPSQALNTPLQSVSTAPVGMYAEVTQTLTNEQGQATAQIPYALIYTNKESTTNLYQLDLSSTSSKVPVQLSNFALSGNEQLCQFALSDVTNANQPSTAYFILQVAPATSQGSNPIFCFDSPGADFQYLLINYGASASTSPTVLPLGSPSLVSFHDLSSGALNGIVGIDTSGNLNFYSDTTFSSPRHLLANASSFHIVSASPTYAFLEVLSTSDSENNSNAGSLYRVDSTGAISADLYDYQSCAAANCLNSSAGIPTPDGRSLFFADNTLTYDENTYDTTGYIDILEKVALDGSSAAQKIYTASGGAPPYPNQQSDEGEVTINFAGFVNSTLIFNVGAYGLDGAGYPGTLNIISQTAGPNTAPAVIASIPDGYFGANVVANGEVLVNEHTFNMDSGNAAGITVAAIEPDGTVANSIPNAYMAAEQYGASGSLVSPVFTVSSILMFDNYVQTGNSTMTLTSLSPTSFAVTPIDSGGMPYTASSGDLENFYFGDYFNPVGGASILTSTSTYATAAAAIDFVNNVFDQLDNDPASAYEPLFY